MTDRVNHGNELSLQDFVDMAQNQQNDHSKIRISKHSGQLTTNSLGAWSSMFHKSKAMREANAAFLQAIRNDPRFANMSEYAFQAFCDQMPPNRTLTPANIRSTLVKAETFIAGYKLVLKCRDELHMPRDTVVKFDQFITRKMKQDPNFRLDVRDYSKAENLPASVRSLPEADQPQAIRALQDEQARTMNKVLAEFLGQAKTFLHTGIGYQPQDVGGDSEKSYLLNQLVFSNDNHTNTTAKRVGNLENLLEQAYQASRNNPEAPYSPLSHIGALFGRIPQGMLGDFEPEAIESLKCLDKDSLKKLGESLRKTGLVGYEKVTVFRMIARCVNTVRKCGEGLPAEAFQASLRTAVNRWITLVDSSSFAAAPFFAVQNEMTVRNLLNNPAMQDEIRQMNIAGLSGEVLSRITQSADFTDTVIKGVGKELKNYYTLDELKAYVLKEARAYIGLGSSGTGLLAQKVQEGDPEALDRAPLYIALGQRLTGIFDCLQGEHPDLPKALSEFKQLEQYIGKAGNAEKPRLYALASQVIGYACGLDKPDADVEPIRTACSRLKRLSEEMTEYTSREDTPVKDRSGIETLKKPLNFVLDMTLGIANLKREELPEVVAPVNPAAIEQALNGQPVVRNATSVEIFQAREQLAAQKLKNEELVSKLMGDLHCPDTALMGEVANVVGPLFKNFTSSEYMDSPAKIVRCLISLGNSLEQLKIHFPKYNANQLRQLLHDAFTMSLPKADQDTMMDLFSDPKRRDLLTACYHELKNETEARRKYADEHRNTLDQGELQTSGKKINQASSGLNLLMEIMGTLRHNPQEPLVDTNNARSFYDLTFNANFCQLIGEMFMVSTNALDVAMTRLSNPPVHEDRERLKKFCGNLQLPLNDLYRQTGISSRVGAHNGLFPVTTTVEDAGEVRTLQWDADLLNTLLAGKASALVDLLKSTNDAPTAAQVWNILCPDRGMPQDLTMENLAEKVVIQYDREVRKYAELLGNREMSGPNFITLVAQTGSTIDQFMKQALKCQTDDLVFEFDENNPPVYANDSYTMHSSGTMYTDGSHQYGFDVDLYRAQMPPGADRDPVHGQEGFSLTLDGKVYSRAELQSQPQGEARDGYLQGMVQAIDNLCGGNKKQLSAVAVCTGQLTQGSLKFSCYDTSHEFSNNEHTAMDYSLKKLENGNIEVSIKEKPGSLFEFRHTYEVDAEGNFHLKKARTVYPSLNKLSGFFNQVPQQPERPAEPDVMEV